MKLDLLLGDVLAQGASDLHLAIGAPPIIRKDGEMRRMDLPTLDAESMDGLLRQLMDEGQYAFFPELMDYDFAFQAQGARFRANAFFNLHGPAAVLRVIPNEVLPLEKLDAPPVLQAFANLEQGLLLVTGPTGSGKSTTLAAIIDHINNSRSAHIITIEDPVEFVHRSQRSLVNQREVGRHTRGFEAALKSALREDPDVILVGEMRDPETIALALTAAETGHLVLGTLHTPSAPRAVYRIIDATPSGARAMVRAMLANSLQAVVAQTLLPKIGGGRTAAHEILVGTGAVRAMIRDDMVPQIFSAIQTGARFGMQSMEEAVRRRVDSGLVDPSVGDAAMSALSGAELGEAAGKTGLVPPKASSKPSGFSF